MASSFSCCFFNGYLKFFILIFDLRDRKGLSVFKDEVLKRLCTVISIERQNIFQKIALRHFFIEKNPANYIPSRFQKVKEVKNKVKMPGFCRINDLIFGLLLHL